MKKILSVLLVVLFCLGLCPVFTSAANEDIIASIKGGTAQIGGTITVPVFLDANKGFVTLGIKVFYDSDVLEIVCKNHNEGSNSCSPSVQRVELASGNSAANSQYHTSNPYRIQWAYGMIKEDIVKTGQIASITFKVKNTATLGNTRVSVEIDQASCYTKKRRTFTGGVADIKLVCAKHISNPGRVTKNPTCTEKGVNTYLCNICNEVARTEDIPAIGHSFGKWTKTKEPTCTAAGEEIRICSNDAKHKEVREIKALGHNFGEWTKTKEPTDTTAGEETRVCLNDAKHKETKKIDKLVSPDEENLNSNNESNIESNLESQQNSTSSEENPNTNNEDNTQSNLDSEQNNTTAEEDSIEQDKTENPSVKKKNTTVWAIAIVGILAIALALVFISMRKRF